MSDWISDVCSSYLRTVTCPGPHADGHRNARRRSACWPRHVDHVRRRHESHGTQLMSLNNNPTRRPLLPILGTILLAACTGVAQAASFTMYRDPSCGCCEAWAAHVRQGDRHDITTVDHPDMASVKTQNDVPDDLRSCPPMIARLAENTSELQSLMR